ncbi:MAG: hypothetical protein MUO82_06455 [Candidatus Thermoplasmatota archaeon]|nr:hypothetical protein [Candidatus Thermoplasmatota archaeon]
MVRYRRKSNYGRKVGGEGSLNSPKSNWMKRQEAFAIKRNRRNNILNNR